MVTTTAHLVFTIQLKAVAIRLWEQTTLSKVMGTLFCVHRMDNVLPLVMDLVRKNDNEK